MFRRCPRRALRGGPLGPVSLNFLLGALGRPPRVTTNQGPKRVLGSQTQLLARTTRANLSPPLQTHTVSREAPETGKKQKVSTSRGSAPAPLGPPGRGCDRNPARTRPRPRRRPSGPFSPLPLFHQCLRPEGPETRSHEATAAQCPDGGPLTVRCGCGVVAERPTRTRVRACTRALRRASPSQRVPQAH